MSEWKKICLVQDIPVLGSRRVQRAKGMDVAVFRNDQDQVFALLDRCPHKGGPATGCAKEPDEGCTQAFRVQVTDGVVHLNQPELDTLALDQTAPIAGPAKKAATV